jgi:PKD repeat protein
MKRFHFLLFIALMIECGFQKVFAQHQYDVWYFGQNAGVDFTSGSPLVLTNGQAITLEGTSSIADSAGSLLFYSDGITVYNKNHQQMVNGFGLNGGFSSSQSALIIRQPGSDSVYYIFTAGEWTTYGLCYSIVDLSLQGGLGEVTQKNISLLTPGTERLTAVRQSNGTDYWIITHGWNSNNFYAYQFSSAGVNNIAVISSSGTPHSGATNNAIGYLKASHNGMHLAVCTLADNYFELFDFDKNTGTISDPIHLDGISNNYGAYGIEFALNDSLLYGSEDSPGIILQWDISSGNATTINASVYSVATTASNYGGAIALASDGKIYLAQQNTMWLGAIQNPNEYGTNCIYVDHAINLSPEICLAGLPNIPPDWFAPVNTGPLSNFAASNVSICEKFCIDYTDQSTNNPASWQWIFPGGVPSSSTDQDPFNICYSNPGVYDVTLITSNASGNDTLTLTNYITVYPTPPFPAITQNGYTLTSSIASTYQWQFNNIDIPGATNQSYDVQQSGYYTVFITDQNGCVSSTTTYILIDGIEDVNSGADVLVYPNPSNGNFIVELSVCTDVVINVINLIGQTIFNSENTGIQGTSNCKFQINLNQNTAKAASAGIYFVEIKTGNVSQRKKIVIE